MQYNLCTDVDAALKLIDCYYETASPNKLITMEKT